METEKQILSFVKELTHLQMTDTGWGNGYIAVPPSHPWHGKDYDSIDCQVHGGLTFGSIKASIKNWAEAKEIPEDYYVFGFDTAHYEDTKWEWTKEAVQKETFKLKQQAENAKTKQKALLTPEYFNEMAHYYFGYFSACEDHEKTMRHFYDLGWPHWDIVKVRRIVKKLNGGSL